MYYLNSKRKKIALIAKLKINLRLTPYTWRSALSQVSICELNYMSDSQRYPLHFRLRSVQCFFSKRINRFITGYAAGTSFQNESFSISSILTVENFHKITFRIDRFCRFNVQIFNQTNTHSKFIFKLATQRYHITKSYFRRLPALERFYRETKFSLLKSTHST